LSKTNGESDSNYDNIDRSCRVTMTIKIVVELWNGCDKVVVVIIETIE
jgi:hypothetical protein